MNRSGFRSGVVEGFYGRPWTDAQRRRLFGWMSDWGLNSYLYAPKDDPKHRAVWRQPYSNVEMRDLSALIHAARRSRIDFIYGIGPGLDLQFASSRDVAALNRRIAQLQNGGCRTFALLFDDVPLAHPEADRKRFGTPARAQALLANLLLTRLSGNERLLFWPTVYCGRMAGGNVADSDYLRELGELLDPSIDVFWTGPEIISEKISVAGIRQLQRVLKRKPLLWDNLHANDYDLRRIYVGPYSGRPEALRNEVSGILSNPNCEFEANYVPIRTLAAFLNAKGPWRPRTAYRAALRQWHGHWRTQGKRRITIGDLELLGDCFYLPTEHGHSARLWLEDLKRIQERPVEQWGNAEARFVEYCARIESLYDVMTTMTNRDLLHTFYRFMWELKEESILLRRYVAWRKSRPPRGARFVSPEHRPGIYRGGLLTELQRLSPI